MTTPSPLKPGDLIAILTPSTVVREQYVSGARDYLLRHGMTVRISPNIKYGENGALAGPATARAADINEAIADPAVRAIWCARGGYGAVELLDRIDTDSLVADPKWLIGFSDISALHALWNRCGIQSLHATMLRRLAAPDADSNPCVSEVMRLLAADYPRIRYSFPSHRFNSIGQAKGRVIGGNLAVLSDLAATPYDLFPQVLSNDTILFLEDVAESISRLQRRLWRLHLAGILSRVKALVFGQFTAYEPNADFRTMEDMIYTRLCQWGYSCPMVFDFPVGHVPDRNYPLIEGQEVKLTVGPGRFTLTSV